MTCPAWKHLFFSFSLCAAVLCFGSLAISSPVDFEIRHDVLAGSIDSETAEFEPLQAMVPDQAENQLLSVQSDDVVPVSESGQSLPRSGSDLMASGTDSVEEALPIPEPASLALIGCLGSMLFLIYGMRSYFDRNAAN